MIEDLMDEIDKQNTARRIIARYTRDQVEWAATTLVELSASPVARMGQVKACELVLQWAAGTPGHFVSIPDYKPGDDIYAAMDAVIAATLQGYCSVETGEQLLDLLKKRAAMALPVAQ